VPEGLNRWNETLCAALRDAHVLGAPAGAILAAAQPMIRQTERHLARLRGVEQQFAFQAAIALVLPWAAAAIAGSITLNPPSLAGAALQAMGIGFFHFLLRRALRPATGDGEWAFGFAISIWMRLLAGMSLHGALSKTIEQFSPHPYAEAWQRWLTAREGGAEATFNWPAGMEASVELSALASSLLKSGAASAEVFSDFIRRVDDERQFRLDERLAALPTRLSLAFCLFFVPSVFLVLLGSLWEEMLVFWA
jgi:hypothetical protein